MFLLVGVSPDIIMQVSILAIVDYFRLITLLYIGSVRDTTFFQRCGMRRVPDFGVGFAVFLDKKRMS